MKRKKYIWMRVSNDGYEFPEMMSESVTELAAMTGVSPASIRTEVSKWERSRGRYHSRWRRVKLEE